MVRVPVRDQDEFDRSVAGQRLQVRLVEGPGVDGHPARRPRGGDEIGVGSAQAHGTRVRGEAEPGQFAAADNAAGFSEVTVPSLHSAHGADEWERPSRHGAADADGGRHREVRAAVAC